MAWSTREPCCGFSSTATRRTASRTPSAGFASRSRRRLGPEPPARLRSPMARPASIGGSGARPCRPDLAERAAASAAIGRSGGFCGGPRTAVPVRYGGAAIGALAVRLGTRRERGRAGPRRAAFSRRQRRPLGRRWPRCPRRSSKAGADAKPVRSRRASAAMGPRSEGRSPGPQPHRTRRSSSARAARARNSSRKRSTPARPGGRAASAP